MHILKIERGRENILKATFDKVKKQVNVHAWFKCIVVAFALIIVAWIIEASNALFTGSGSAWVVLVYYVGLTVIIGSIIWFILYVSPNLIQSLLKTSNNPPAPTKPRQETESHQTENFNTKKSEATAPVQVEWVPVRREIPPAQDETDSERLRREYRNRGF